MGAIHDTSYAGSVFRITEGTASFGLAGIRREGCIAPHCGSVQERVTSANGWGPLCFCIAIRTRLTSWENGVDEHVNRALLWYNGL